MRAISRREESHARAKKPCWEERRAIHNSVRDAYTWNPIIDWSEADVWEACGTSQQDLAIRRMFWRLGREEEALDGWPAHPAHVMGNERLSCALCVLASRNDLENGAHHNPELLRTLIEMEEESGFTFRQDLALSELGTL